MRRDPGLLHLQTMAARTRLAVAALLFLPALGGCWINPATGRAELNLIGEDDEIELGRRFDAEIVDSYGLVKDSELQTYVATVGQRVAATSNRADLTWTFRVLDDPEVNAFALPGGFVYVTRGLLLHVGSEDALAAVLAHEVGHVAAKHSVNRVSRAALGGTGIGLLSVVAPGMGRRASTRMQLDFLAHSRDDEIEADDLGVRYAEAAGYDPRSMLPVLDTLRGLQEASGAEKVPAHLATHPDPEFRLGRLVARLGELVPPDLPGDKRLRFYDRTKGLLYGEDARDGFTLGARWIYPRGGVQTSFPEGWKVSHRPGLVVAFNEQDSALVLARAGEAETPEAAEATFAQSGVRLGQRRKLETGGLPNLSGWFVVEEQPTRFQGVYAFVEQGDTVWELVALTTVEAFTELAPTLETTLGDFGPVDPAFATLEPRRVEIRQTSSPGTLRELHATNPVSLDLDRLALINGVNADDALPVGSTIRWVVGFTPPSSAGD